MPKKRRDEGSKGGGKVPSKRKLIYLSVSIIVTGFIFWFLFTRITLNEIAAFISAIDTKILPWFFACSLASSISRTWSYALLLSSSGYNPSRFYLFLVVLIRNTLSDSLPARLGTLSYIALVTTRLGVSVGAATASFAVAFIFEILALVPLALLAVLSVVWSADISPLPFLVAGAILAAIGGALVYLLPEALEFGALISSKVKWQRITSIFLEAKKDVILAKSRGLYLKVLILSVFTRIFKYGGLYFLLLSMLSPHGLTVGDIPPGKAFLGIAAAELSASLPISGIGGFGAYQGTWVAVFTLLGFPEKLTLLTSVSHHLFTQAYGYSLGAIAGVVLIVTGWCRRKSSSGNVASVA